VDCHVRPRYQWRAKLPLAAIELVTVGLVALVWSPVRRGRRCTAGKVKS